MIVNGPVYLRPSGWTTKIHRCPSPLGTSDITELCLCELCQGGKFKFHEAEFVLDAVIGGCKRAVPLADRTSCNLRLGIPQRLRVFGSHWERCGGGHLALRVPG